MQSIQHPVPDELRGLFGRRHIDDRLGNLVPREEVYPDQGAPIVRREGETIVLQNARWGPAAPKASPQCERHRSRRDEHPEHDGTMQRQTQDLLS